MYVYVHCGEMRRCSGLATYGAERVIIFLCIICSNSSYITSNDIVSGLGKIDCCNSTL